MTDNVALQVWKGTTEVGCAQTYCTPVRDGNGEWAWVSCFSSRLSTCMGLLTASLQQDGFYLVCEYLPPGEYALTLDRDVTKV